MRLSLKHILLSSFLAFEVTPAAQAQANLGAPTQFLQACDTDNLTYDRLHSHVSRQNWTKITEEGVVEEFFPDLSSEGVENAAVFEFNYADSQSSEAWYLGILKARVPEGLILYCQLRSFDQSVDGLRESLERSLRLTGQKIPSPEDSEVYNYAKGDETTYYDVWERKLEEGDYVFAVGKTIVYAVGNSN